ncbi:hypothetical protein DID88_006346 [Monilinia fructigena]|uniref:Uncharacterized protein n=1 Tax=Monilinia fructigena TaxID=38457 RepID=A0A395J2U1_9HELO|nr:hypothetical protein DID88_006346 [Monilinia fructigena]
MSRTVDGYIWKRIPIQLDWHTKDFQLNYCELQSRQMRESSRIKGLFLSRHTNGNNVAKELIRKAIFTASCPLLLLLLLLHHASNCRNDLRVLVSGSALLIVWDSSDGNASAVTGSRSTWGSEDLVDTGTLSAGTSNESVVGKDNEPKALFFPAV